MCSINSRLMLSLLKESAVPSLVPPPVCYKQTYCTTTGPRAVVQLTEEEKQLGKRKSKEIAATKILKNLSEDEKIKLQRLKMEYENLKAEMGIVRTSSLICISETYEPPHEKTCLWRF